MEQDWRNVNYNAGYKNVKELFVGATLGIPNGAILTAYIAFCFITILINN